jgi:[ribosomal protein S5]-alanine N-acetyltransferase
MEIPFITSFGMIRAWEEQDVPALVKYANNVNIWKNLRDGFAHPYTASHAQVFLESVGRQNPTTFYAIATAEEAIGAIGLSINQDVHRFNAELGYWLGEPFWGRGYMSEAVALFCDFGFETYGLNRIYAEPYASNLASGRILEKAGFVLEGRLKCSVVKDGQILDQFLFAKINPSISNPILDLD